MPKKKKKKAIKKTKKTVKKIASKEPKIKKAKKKTVKKSLAKTTTKTKKRTTPKSVYCKIVKRPTMPKRTAPINVWIEWDKKMAKWEKEFGIHNKKCGQSKRIIDKIISKHSKKKKTIGDKIEEIIF
jgi:hypothetical protein